MNVLSLFDGISCGMVALERAGIKVDKYFSSEIDKNAIAISEKNYPNIIRLGDVTKHSNWELPRIDLLIGGSPCQGFSRNGLMLNFEDVRSRLFFEYVEILKEIRAYNPNVYFLLENVEMKKEWEEVITEMLGVKPKLINSKFVSAQSRPRLYWTNIPYEMPKDKGICLLDILGQADISDYKKYKGLLVDNSYDDKAIDLIDVVDGEIRIRQATKQGYIVAENGDGINLQFPTSKTRRGRVIKQKSSTLDCQCEVSVLYNGIIRKLNVQELERLQTLPSGYTDGFNDKVSKKAIGNGWTVDVIAHIFKGLSNSNK